jgi:hypothetical protein
MSTQKKKLIGVLVIVIFFSLITYSLAVNKRTSTFLRGQVADDAGGEVPQCARLLDVCFTNTDNPKYNCCKEDGSICELLAGHRTKGKCKMSKEEGKEEPCADRVGSSKEFSDVPPDQIPTYRNSCANMTKHAPDCPKHCISRKENVFSSVRDGNGNYDVACQTINRCCKNPSEDKCQEKETES